MKDFFWFTAKTAFLLHFISCEVLPPESKCNYKTGFCNIDVDDCLKSPRYRDEFPQCRRLKYDELYYDTSNYTTFSVNYNSPGGDSTYVLMSINKETETWRPFKDCCDVRLGQPCHLRPIHDDEFLQVFVTDGSPVCYDYINVHSAAESRWCKSMEDEPPCLILENGHVVLQTSLEPVSTHSFTVRLRSDCCYFSVPKEIVFGDTSNRELVWNVPRMSILEENGREAVESGNALTEQVETELGLVPCEVRENITDVKKYLLNYEFPAEHASCFFVRTRRGPWKQTPVCIKPPAENPSGSVWKITLIVLSVLLIALVTLVMLRNRIRLCIPSYADSKEEISKHVASMNEHEEFLNTSGTIGIPPKELPDEITFIGLQNETKPESGLYSQTLGRDDTLLENGDKFLLQKSENSSPHRDTIDDSGCVIDVLRDGRNFSSCPTMTPVRISSTEVKIISSEDCTVSPDDSAIAMVSQNSLDYTEKDSVLTKPQEIRNCSTVSQFPSDLLDFKSDVLDKPISSTDNDCADVGISTETKDNIQLKQDISDYVKKSRLAVG